MLHGAIQEIKVARFFMDHSVVGRVSSTPNFQVAVPISPRAIAKQRYQHTVWLGQLSLLPSAGWEMSSSVRATGWRPSVVDWGCGMCALWTAGPFVHWRRRWMAA